MLHLAAYELINLEPKNAILLLLTCGRDLEHPSPPSIINELKAEYTEKRDIVRKCESIERMYLNRKYLELLFLFLSPFALHKFITFDPYQLSLQFELIRLSIYFRFR
jgi:hypothetical protein